MTKVTMIAVGTTVVVALGLMIATQSQTSFKPSACEPRQHMIYADGRIEGSTPEIELRPQMTGQITNVYVEEGQAVEAGEVLLTLDDRQYRCDVALAAAELEMAKAQRERLLNGAHPQQRSEARAMYEAKRAEWERARVSWERINNLREARAVSQQEADDKKTLLDTLTAEVAAAKARMIRLDASARPDEVEIENARIQAASARLELAKVRQDQTVLRAPCRGQILKVDCREGELTSPASAEPAIIMADTSHYYVRAYVDELDAPRLKLGMNATITADGLPGDGLKGRVIRLSPRMGHKELWSNRPTERQDTKTREIWIELEDEHSLLLGLRVDVVVDPRQATPTTAEPTTIDNTTRIGPSEPQVHESVFQSENHEQR
ncbi:MAG: HlyD family secretion protein [Pirellulales bacterium]|nr:HlyD family secretion protein [Pirellulales bacterium]